MQKKLQEKAAMLPGQAQRETLFQCHYLRSFLFLTGEIPKHWMFSKASILTE